MLESSSNKNDIEVMERVPNRSIWQYPIWSSFVNEQDKEGQLGNSFSPKLLHAVRNGNQSRLPQRFLACDLSWHADVGYYSYTDSYEQEKPYEDGTNDLG